MSSVIGWPNNVNKIISDQTSITVGEGGYQEDSASTGHSERVLTQLVSPRQFSVVMFFNYSEKDENGLSEYDRFERWFEFYHKRGTVPFEFPSITKFNVDSSATKGYEYCRYKITSSLNVSKSGLDMQVSMTWKEVYSGIINIKEDTGTASMVNFYAENGSYYVLLDKEPATAPTMNNNNYEFAVTKNGVFVDVEVYSISAIGNKLVYSVQKLASGDYVIKCTEKSSSTSRLTTLSV